jgi:hypothetical protein
MDIKNLSIALEALSRIPGVEGQSLRIRGILEEAITDAEERSTRTPVYSRPPTPPEAYLPNTDERLSGHDGSFADIPF